jgi:hypothetical protein
MAYNDIQVESFQTLGICQMFSLSCKVAINNFSCAFGEGKKLMVVGWIVDGYVKVFWAKV